MPLIELSGNSSGSVSLELDTTNLETRYKTNPVRAKDIVAMRMPIWYDDIQRPIPGIPVRATSDLLVTRTTAD
jgi:hypothetical protein